MLAYVACFKSEMRNAREHGAEFFQQLLIDGHLFDPSPSSTGNLPTLADKAYRSRILN